MTDKELKSCPFCGGKPKWVGSNFFGKRLQCEKCNCGPFKDNRMKSEREAIESWNTRINP